MQPPPRCFISGTAMRQAYTCVKKLIAKASCHCSLGRVSNGPAMSAGTVDDSVRYTAREQGVQPLLPGVETLFCHLYGGVPCQDEQVLVVRLLAICMDAATRWDLHQRQPSPRSRKIARQVDCGDL